MLGIEAIDLTPSIIVVLDAVSESYRAIKDIRDLPPVLSEAAEQPALAQRATEKVLRNIKQGKADDYVYAGIMPTLIRCMENAKTLERILHDLAKSPSHTSSFQRYSKLLRIFVKDDRVKVLISRILEDLSLVASDMTNKKAHKGKYISISFQFQWKETK